MSAARTGMPAWREERWNRIDIVRHFVSRIDERDMAAVAMLMMRGLGPKRIMADLGMDEAGFRIAKEKLAFGLLFAGVTVRS